MLVFYQLYILMTKMINQIKIAVYETEMCRNIFSAARVCTALFFGIGGFTLNQAYETIDFFCAQNKRNIENDFWATDAEKENKKRICDAFYSSLKSQLRCKQ